MLSVALGGAAFCFQRSVIHSLFFIQNIICTHAHITHARVHDTLKYLKIVSFNEQPPSRHTGNLCRLQPKNNQVTGRTMQMQGRTGDSRYNNQQQRGGRGRGYYGEPQPWPTGFLVEAPPSPKPWRGEDRVLLASHRHHYPHHDGSSSSSGSISWRTGRSNSNGTLSSADDTSSQESSVADWQAADSEDGESGVEGGGGGIAGAGSGARASQASRRAGAGEGGTEGRAVPGNGGSGGNNAPAGAGADAGRHGSSSNHRRKDAGHAGAGEAAPREHLPPLAPVPRLGAYPAQHLGHGTAGGNGGGKVGLRTVPLLRAHPSPRRAGAGGGGGGGGEALREPSRPAAAHATVAELPSAANATGATGSAPGSGGAAAEAAGSAPGAAPGGSRRRGDMSGPLSPSRVGGGGGGGGAEDASAARRRQAVPDGEAGAVRGKEQQQQQMAVTTKAPLSTPAAAAAAADRSREPVAARTQCGNASRGATIVRSTQQAEGNGAAMARGGQRGGPVSCVPVRAVSTKVAVRQWRRMFLP